jgi:hypothetical protein
MEKRRGKTFFFFTGKKGIEDLYKKKRIRFKLTVLIVAFLADFYNRIFAAFGII